MPRNVDNSEEEATLPVRISTESVIKATLGDVALLPLRIAVKRYQQTAGFFTPYRSGKDFFISLSAPISAPLTLAILAALSAAAVAAAALVIVGALAVAAVAAIFKKNHLARTALAVAIFGAVVGVIALICAPALAIASILSIPVSIVNIVTRSGATVVDAVKGCCEEIDESELITRYGRIVYSVDI